MTCQVMVAMNGAAYRDDKVEVPMNALVSLALAVATAIHLAPAVGALGPGALKRLYGVEATGDLELLGGAWISVVSFLLLAWQVPHGGALRRVATLDAIALVPLSAGLLAQLLG